MLMALAGAILCAVACEAINWFLIYRQEEYKDLTKQIVTNTERLEAQKEKLVYNAGIVSAN